MGEEAAFWLTEMGNNGKYKFEQELVWYSFLAQLMSFFYTGRKNDKLRNETNSIKEQERMGNIQGTGNIRGTILGYIYFFS